MPSQTPPRPGQYGAPSARPTATAAAGLTPKDILGILRRRMWLIILLTVLATIAAGGLYYLCLIHYPRFTSRGMIRVKMPVHQDPLTGGTLVPQAAIIELEAQNKALFLRNEAFLAQVLVRSAVQGTSWFERRRFDEARQLEDLQRSFSASPQRNSEFVIVSLSLDKGAEAQVILNEILTLFEQEMRQQATGGLRARQSTLESQRSQVEGELRRRRERLASLSRAANVPGWERGQTVVMQELNALHQEKLRLEYQLNELRLARSLLEEEVAGGGVSNDVRMAVEQDPLVNGYRNRISGLREEVDQKLNEFGEDHREVRALLTRIESNQQRLNERMQQLQEQYANTELLAYDRRIETVEQQLLSINNEFAAVSARQSDLDQKFTEYLQVQDEVAQLQDRLALFDQQIGNTRAAIDDRAVAFAEVAVRATSPRTRSFPRLQVFIPAGVVLGLLLGVGLAFLIEFVDDTVKSPVDVHRHLGVTNLGMVPLHEAGEQGLPQMAKIVVTQPHEIVSEFMRRLKTNVAFSAPTDELKTILLTSCAAKCGKSTTAMNLALAFAADGERVLLVDANFRRPALSKLNKAADRGFSDLLIGRAQLDDVITATEHQGLDFMAAGTAPPNPTNLLSSQSMKDFLAAVRQRYDRIFFDGPPALVVTDASVIAGQVDGSIITVRAGSVGRGVVQRLIRELRQSNGRILGVVLNGVKPRRGGYLRETFERYYDYVGTAEAAPVASAT